MSYDTVQEEVPSFTRRVGDQAIQGSNNTLIVLGTDRGRKGPASVDDGLGHVDAPGGGKMAGTIHIVTGRAAPDPDLLKDSSYLYLSMKTKVDTNLGLESLEKNSDGKAAAILKSDAVRIVYRENLKVCISDGTNFVYMDDGVVKIGVGSNLLTLDGKKLYGKVGESEIAVTSGEMEWKAGSAKINASSAEVVVDAPVIKLGDKNASHPVVYGDDLMVKFDNHKHPSAVGPTGTPLPDGLLTAGNLSSVVKVK